MKKAAIGIPLALVGIWVLFRFLSSGQTQPQSPAVVEAVARDHRGFVPSQALPPSPHAATKAAESESVSVESTSTSMPESNKKESGEFEPIQLRLQQSYRPDDDSRVRKILREAKVDVYESLVKRSRSIESPNDKLLNAIKGRFAGQLPPSPFNKEAWNVETELQVDEDGTGAWNAEYHIMLSSDIAGQIAHTSGTGAVNALRKVDGEGGLLLEVSPKMFIHAFYIQPADVLTGNFYSIDDSGKTRYHGTLILTRR